MIGKRDHKEIAEGMIFVFSLGVIFWAIVVGIAAPEPPEAPSLSECVQRGWVDTDRGPVFCTLIKR